MLAETHWRIALALSETLNLEDSDVGLLADGSLAPDTWGSFPHHTNKDREIASRIIEARRLLDSGNPQYMFSLGVAAHYIVDRWTSIIRGLADHHLWEKNVESSQILDNLQLKSEIIKTAPEEKVAGVYLAFINDLERGRIPPTSSTAAALRRYRERLGSTASRTRHSSSYDQSTTVARRRERDDLEYLSDPSGRSSASRNTDFCVKAVSYALVDRPSQWSSPSLDLNMAYRVCLEVVKSIMSII